MSSSINNNLTQSQIITEFFEKHPNRNVSHPEIVDWAIDEYKKRTGKIFRDPDRQIRKLYQTGFLIKIKKGIYRYDPKFVKQKDWDSFSPALKEAIFKRDNYRCVICGKGAKEGVELHVDHIKPRYLGGKSTLENGQTLCSQHNFLKKNLKQTETGKRLFIRLYELAKKEKNQSLIDFCVDVLKIYDEHDINSHIEWEK